LTSLLVTQQGLDRKRHRYCHQFTELATQIANFLFNPSLLTCFTQNQGGLSTGYFSNIETTTAAAAAAAVCPSQLN